MLAVQRNLMFPSFCWNLRAARSCCESSTYYGECKQYSYSSSVMIFTPEPRGIDRVLVHIPSRLCVCVGMLVTRQVVVSRFPPWLVPDLRFGSLRDRPCGCSVFFDFHLLLSYSRRSCLSFCFRHTMPVAATSVQQKLVSK